MGGIRGRGGKSWRVRGNMEGEGEVMEKHRRKGKKRVGNGRERGEKSRRAFRGKENDRGNEGEKNYGTALRERDET